MLTQFFYIRIRIGRPDFLVWFFCLFIVILSENMCFQGPSFPTCTLRN